MEGEAFEGLGGEGEEWILLSVRFGGVVRDGLVVFAETRNLFSIARIEWHVVGMDEGLLSIKTSALQVH